MESIKPRFEELYYKYYGKVYKYIRRKIYSQDDVEDLTQECFEYCYRVYESYDSNKSSISTWLFLIVNSRVKNYYRDRKTLENISDYENLLPSDCNEMEQAVYLEELKQTIIKALGQLNQKQRDAVVMKYFKNMSHAQISKQMGISEANSRVILTRALMNLRETIQDFSC